MPSTYTVNLGIEKPATGEQSGTWGDTTNVNFDILDQAINGAERVTLTSAGSSGSPNSLQITNGATSDGRNKWIEFYSSGDLGGSAYVQLDPNDAEKIVFVRNSLAGSQSVILFQGTYNSGRDLEISAGVDMVVKFDGGGASAATVTDVYTNLKVTGLVAGTADINGGTVDGTVIGGASAAALTATTVVANTSLNIAGDGATVTGIKDEDDMASNSATKLATQQSIKAYVDSQVGTVDTLSEILANGNTTGANDIDVDAAQKVQFRDAAIYINSSVDGQLDIVADTEIQIAATTIDINGAIVASGEISAASLDISGDVDIDGTLNVDAIDIDGAVQLDNTLTVGVDDTGYDVKFYGATGGAYMLWDESADDLILAGAAGLVVAGNVDFNGDLDVDGTTNLDVVDIDGAVDMASTLTVGSTLTVAGSLADWSVDSQGVIMNFARNSANYIKAGTASGYLIFQTNGATTALTLDPSQNATIAGGLTVQGATVFNENGVDADFRVESDTNTHALFVDAGTSRVGINKSAPNRALDVHSGTASDITTFANDAGGYTFGYTANLASWDLGASDTLRFRHGSTETLRLKTTESVFNELSADLDFRVESNGNANMLFVDGGNNRVGIGTGAPSYEFVVSKDGSSGIEFGPEGVNDTTSFIQFYNRSTAAYDTARIYAKQFELYLEAAQVIALQISTVEAVINQSGTDLDFRVESDSNPQALLVDAGGNFVAMGNTTKIPVSGFSDQHGFGFDALTGSTQIASDGIPLEIGRTTTGGSNGLFIQMREQSNVVGTIGNYNGVPYIGYGGGTGGGIMFNGRSIEPTGLGATRTDGANDIGSSTYGWKDLYLTGGIQFDSRSNKLDDYEEGTWTPALNMTSGSVSYASQLGQYTKIGSQVTLTGWIYIDGVSSPSGDLSVTVPFLASSTNTRPSAMIMANNTTGVTGNIGMWVNPNTATMYFQIVNNADLAALDGSNMATNTELYVTITYITT
jgi:cytoskeletal protein CcmA (bactofilin family)